MLTLLREGADRNDIAGRRRVAALVYFQDLAGRTAREVRDDDIETERDTRLCFSSALRVCVSRRERVDECRYSSQRNPLRAFLSAALASRHCSLRTSSMASLSALTMWNRSSTNWAFGQ